MYPMLANWLVAGSPDRHAYEGGPTGALRLLVAIGLIGLGVMALGAAC